MSSHATAHIRSLILVNKLAFPNEFQKKRNKQYAPDLPEPYEYCGDGKWENNIEANCPITESATTKGWGPHKSRKFTIFQRLSLQPCKQARTMFLQRVRALSRKQQLQQQRLRVQKASHIPTRTSISHFSFHFEDCR